MTQAISVYISKIIFGLEICCEMRKIHWTKNTTIYWTETYLHPSSMISRCHVPWEVGNQHINTMKQNQLTEGLVLKLNEAIIHHPPFWEYDTWQFNYNNLLGMYMVVCYNNKVCGQSGLIVPRFPGSGILVPCRHGWIFVTAQVWHGMLQALVPGHSFEQLVWQEQLEPGSSELLMLWVQWMWAACMV